MLPCGSPALIRPKNRSTKKPAAFKMVNGVAFPRVDIPKKPREVGVKPPSAALSPTRKFKPQPPKFVSNCNEVLCFQGYFMEAVSESNDEMSRVRKCRIQFYLEDEKLEITEIRQENSGMSQGQFLKKCKVPKDAGGNNGAAAFVGTEDLRVGEMLKVYGRTFKLVDCDKATRDWYKKRGEAQATSEPFPGDALHESVMYPCATAECSELEPDTCTWHGTVEVDSDSDRRAAG